MEVVLTTLCENTTAKPGFMAEWGLSFLVQVDDTKVLFDAGTSTVAIHNAAMLNMDLSSVAKIVISHGHHDHTGGLVNVLQMTGKKEVIAHPDIWESKYTKRKHEEKAAFVGINYSREALESMGANFHLSKEPVTVTNEILTTGEVEITNDFEIIESNLFVNKNGVLIPDILSDDISLVIKTPQGLIVVLGCAHRGMINHIRHAIKITGENRVYAVVGGTHLVLASEERIAKTIAELKELDIKKIGVSHCTGFKASMGLARAFGDKFFLNNAGTQCRLL